MDSPQRPKKHRAPDLHRMRKVIDLCKAMGVQRYKEDGFEFEFAPPPIDYERLAAIARAEAAQETDPDDRPMTEAARAKWRKERMRITPEDAAS